jgi:hypothetical protein
VVAHALRIVVESVSIVQDEGSLGHTTAPLPENADSSDEEADAILEKHLIVGVAGAASEELLTEELSDLRGKDLEGVAKLLMGLSDTDAPVQADSEEALDKAPLGFSINRGSLPIDARFVLDTRCGRSRISAYRACGERARL